MKPVIQLWKRIYNHEQADSLATTLRNKRLNLFKSLLLSLPKPAKVLDVGGRAEFWESTGLLDAEPELVEITLLNISEQEIGKNYRQLRQVVGNACDMAQFQDQEFDVVFSNSVIEHVGTYEDQRCMAREIARVGKRYFVQTPNFFFPIEPHFVFPAFHWLPIELRVWLITHFALGWFGKYSDVNSARAAVKEINLLSKKQFTLLFPRAHLYEEKFLGMTKSLIAYYGWENSVKL